MTQELRRASLPLDPKRPGWCRYCGEAIIVPEGKTVHKALRWTLDPADLPAGLHLYTRARWHPWCVNDYNILQNPGGNIRAWLRRQPRCRQCGVDCGTVHETLDRWIDGGHRRNILAAIKHEHVPWCGALLRGVGWNTRGTMLRHAGFGHEGRIADIDHRVPLWAGGEHAIANLQTLCVICHKAKTAREAGERARARSPQLTMEGL